MNPDLDSYPPSSHDSIQHDGCLSSAESPTLSSSSIPNYHGMAKTNDDDCDVDSISEDPRYGCDDDKGIIYRQDASPGTRKRTFLRRGGGSHMTLFKAAALAAMSSPIDCDEEHSSEGRNSEEDDDRLHRFKRYATLPPVVPELGLGVHSEKAFHPRKRLKGEEVDNQLDMIDAASLRLNGLQVGAPSRKSNTHEPGFANAADLNE